MNDLAPWNDLLRLSLTLFGCLAALAIVRRLPVRREDSDHPHAGYFRRQLVTAIGGVIAVVLVIIALPVAPELRGQLLSLFGLAITALLTLSGTTFVSNAMAGLMLRSLANFRAGDFLRVEGHFGRVTERGLLHTEIQTEDRDLVTLPNLYLITQPVRVVHASGTLVTCSLSLGYDLPRKRVTAALEQAALDADLTEPFVQVMGLGDHSVSYRVCGFLEDVRTLVSARARLNACALDALHGAGIEIVSPTFVSQRILPADTVVRPPSAQASQSEDVPAESASDSDRIMFEKAETAARVTELREDRKRLQAEISLLEADGDATREMDARRRRLELGLRQRQLAALDAVLEETGEAGTD